MKNQNRETFRETVFGRDNYGCVVHSCDKEVADAHHLIERRLWIKSKEKGGYLVDNGVSLCNFHHQLAERNILSPQVLRMFANITKRILPEQLDPSYDYDKWGEVMNPLKRIYLYKNAVKYPSTSFFSFSPNLEQARETNPIISIDNLIGYPIVFTIKMDGSNITMTNKYVAARNGKDARHRSFDYCKSIQAMVSHLIPNDVQIFGEWMYAKHSIRYIDGLSIKSYFQLFGLYNQEKHIFLSWDDVERMARKLGQSTVPVIKKGTYYDKHQLKADIIKLGEDVISKGHEGVTVRSVYPFHYSQFPVYLAKYVRKNHVAKNAKHWQTTKIIKNQLER